MRTLFFPTGRRRPVASRPAFVRIGLETLPDRITPALFLPATTAYSSSSTLDNNGSVATGDFNEDGKMDIVVSNYGSSKDQFPLAADDPGKTVTVLFGTGTGSFSTASTIPVGPANAFVSFVAVDDVDGDGHKDIVACWTTSTPAGANGFVSVFKGTGFGAFNQVGTSIPTAYNNASWVGIADLTGDGIKDLAVAHFGASDSAMTTVNGEGVYLAQGTGGGNFTQLANINNGFSFFPTSAAIADFTGDGKLDIVCTVPGVPPDSTSAQPQGTIVLMTNQGAGSFSFGTNVDSGGKNPIACAAGDLNGDGKIDLVVANAGDPDANNLYANFGSGTSVAVFLNGGSSFAPPTVLTAGLKSAFAVAISDLDVDGDKDIAAVSYGTPFSNTNGKVAVYLNNGSGQYAPDLNSPYDAGASDRQFLAIAPFNTNTDATPDIVTVGFSNTTLFTITSLLNTATPSLATTAKVTASVNPTTVGQSVTFTATIASPGGTPTGTVTFFDGATSLGTGTLGGGSATFTTTALAAGSHSITVSYAGSGGFGPSTSPAITQQVNLNSTNIVVTSIPNPSATGQNVIFTATANSPTGTPVGTVTFFDGATTLGTAKLAGGQAQFNTTALSIGSHSITVSLATNASYSGSTSTPLTQVVNLVGTSGSVAANVNPSLVNQVVTFTATFSASGGGPAPAGSVTFFDGMTSLGSGTLSGGTATFATGSLTAGSHTITVNFAGDSTYAASTSPALTQVVNKNAATATATVSPTPTTYGTNVTLTATVTSPAGTPTGTVTFLDSYTDTFGNPVIFANLGTGTLSGGVATLMTSALPATTHGITVSYAGDATFQNSLSTAATLQINPASTSMTLTPSASTITQGQSVTLTAVVAAVSGTPNGTVTFFDNGASIGTGALFTVGSERHATLSTSNLALGAHSLTATFAANSNFQTSSAGPATVQVNAPVVADTTTSLATSGSPSFVGASVTFTATVVSNNNTVPTGSVAFFDGATPLGTGALTTAGGQQKATFTTSTLSSGARPITAQYQGAALFNTSASQTLTQIVNPVPTTLSLNASPSAGNAGTPISLTATLIPSQTAGPPTGTVTFKNGTTVLGTAPLTSAGNAIFTPSTLPVGTAIITADYSGDSAYAASTAGGISVAVSPVVNTPPTIANITDKVVTAGSTLGPVGFTVGDAETPAANLTLAVTSTGPIPASAISFGGSGANRTLSIASLAGTTGTSTVTVTVTDASGSTASDSFVVAVNAAVPGTKEFSVGRDIGGANAVRLFNPDRSERYNLSPFGLSFTGGVRTAAADFTGDGVADLVAASGPGIAGRVIVYDGVTQAVLFDIVPFGDTFVRGVLVAAGDMTGDGKAELVITAEKGGGARVRIFTPTSTSGGFKQTTDFFGLVGNDGVADTNFRGGSRAAVGDINGDGKGDLVFAAGAGGGPRIAIFDGATLGQSGGKKIGGDFFAFEPALRNGTYVAAGDINGDGFAEIITGAGPGGGPRTAIFDGTGLLAGQQTKIADFFLGDTNNRGGIRVAVKNLDNDTKLDLIVGSGTGGGSLVSGYAGASITPGVNPTAAFSFDAYPNFTGGVYVG